MKGSPNTNMISSPCNTPIHSGHGWPVYLEGMSRNWKDLGGNWMGWVGNKKGRLEGGEGEGWRKSKRKLNVELRGDDWP